MPNVVRFVLESQRNLDVPGAGRFIAGVLDVPAVNLDRVALVRFLVPPYGGKEFGTVDSASTAPALPAVPLPPPADPLPMYALDSEVGHLAAQDLQTPGTELYLAGRAAFLPRWTANTAYLAGDLRLSPTGQIVSRKANGTSGATYDPTAWDIVSGGGSGGASTVDCITDATTVGKAVMKAATAAAARSAIGAGVSSFSGSYTDLTDKPATETPAPTRALGIFRAGLTSRKVTPCRLAFTGSSTTEGNNATSAANRYVNLLVGMIQAAYPSGTGSETAVVTSNSATWGTLSTAAGVHGYNAGEQGTTSADYLTSAERTRIAAINPRMVMHMVFANDYRLGVPVATAKANLLASITDLKSKMTEPCVHVLVNTYPRYDAATTANKVAEWSAYSQAMIEIAAADPANVAYLDIAPSYAVVGIPGTDPLNLIDTDDVHQTDLGHAFMADLLRTALGILQVTVVSGGSSDTTAPTAPGTPTATAGVNSASVAFASSTDNVAVTGYRVFSSADNYASPVATGSASSINVGSLVAGTAVTFKVAAYDAAGNTSAQSAASNLVTPTAPPAGGLSIYTSDTMTPDATTFNGRSTDAVAGGTARPYQTSTTGASLATSGGVMVRGATVAAYTAAVAVPSVNCSVSAKIVALPTSATISFSILRQALAASAAYRMSIATTGAVTVQRLSTDGATATDLGINTTVVAGDTLKLSRIDGTVALLKNGAQVGSVADSTITTAGLAGITTGSSSASFQIDDMVWEYAP